MWRWFYVNQTCFLITSAFVLNFTEKKFGNYIFPHCLFLQPRCKPPFGHLVCFYHILSFSHFGRIKCTLVWMLKYVQSTVTEFSQIWWEIEDRRRIEDMKEEDVGQRQARQDKLNLKCICKINLINYITPHKGKPSSLCMCVATILQQNPITYSF